MISAQNCARWKHMKYHLPAMAFGMIVSHITQPFLSRHTTLFLLEEGSPGVIKKSLIGGGFAPSSNPLTFSIPFLTETKKYPLHMPSLEVSQLL